MREVKGLCSGTGINLGPYAKQEVGRKCEEELFYRVLSFPKPGTMVWPFPYSNCESLLGLISGCLNPM